MDQSLIAQVGAIVEKMEVEHGKPALARIRELLAITLGQKPRPASDPQQKPSMFFMPSLEAKAWHDPADYPWTKTLEAAYRGMRNEVLAQVVGPDCLTAAGDPIPEKVDRGLNQVPWKHINLHEGNNAAQFPGLTRTLRSTFRAQVGEPLQFKLLLFRPGQRFGPRFTDNNQQLTFRLGLYRDGGKVRTGTEVRTWREGQCLVCDDSFQHETWHEGTDEPRLLLVGRVWHPGLTDVEIRALIGLSRAMAAAAGGEQEVQWKAKLDQVKGA